jgi:hypothetical protein
MVMSSDRSGNGSIMSPETMTTTAGVISKSSVRAVMMNFRDVAEVRDDVDGAV